MAIMSAFMAMGACHLLSALQEDLVSDFLRCTEIIISLGFMPLGTNVPVKILVRQCQCEQQCNRGYSRALTEAAVNLL